MNNDNNGIADDPRHGQQQEAKATPEGCEETHGERNTRSEGCRLDDEQEDLEKVESILEAVPEPLRELIAEAMITRTWSGLLPDPASFEKYPEWVQHKMTDWNDAKIIDESKRLDKIAEAAIADIKLETVLTFAINAIFAFTAFFAFIITNNAASFGLLSVPGITIAVNLWRNRQKDDAPETET
ncbi:MAG: hypothetical protein RR842_11095 [Gordonibacter sp.]|uniref:hypothetical protein n=1 Tax=Gordonibacter sp. TaxID=1968902 RepID=UPI002FC9777E